MCMIMTALLDAFHGKTASMAGTSCGAAGPALAMASMMSCRWFLEEGGRSKQAFTKRCNAMRVPRERARCCDTRRKKQQKRMREGLVGLMKSELA